MSRGASSRGAPQGLGAHAVLHDIGAADVVYVRDVGTSPDAGQHWRYVVERRAAFARFTSPAADRRVSARCSTCRCIHRAPVPTRLRNACR